MDSRILLERMRHSVKRRTPLSIEAKRVLKALIITLSLILLGASALLLYQSSKNAEQGFLLRQTSLENEKIKTENEELKQKVLGAQSFQGISESKTLKGMEKAGESMYVIPKKK